MWVLLHLRHSLCPHHILSSLKFKYFYVNLHKLHYFVYAQLVSTDLRLTSAKHLCVQHMLFILRITLKTVLSYTRRLEVANFLRRFQKFLHALTCQRSLFCRFCSYFFFVYRTFFSAFLTSHVYFASSQAAFLLLCARPVILFSGTH